MSTPSIFRLISIPLILVIAANAAEVARWIAGEPPVAEGLSPVRGPDADWTIQKIDGEYVAYVKPVADYYRRATLLLKVKRTVRGRVWLVLNYLDRGYNLISVSTAKPGKISDQSGVVRLNTGRFRNAVFAIDGALYEATGSAEADIEVHGVEHVRSVTLVDIEPAREIAPTVAPPSRLNKPIDLVMSAGADTRTLDDLPQGLASLKTKLPLLRALGFQGVESYVKWNFVERSRGVFDWSYYDAVVDEIERQGLKWFPLLIVGSAYSLPEWFHNSEEMTGYACLEHGIKVEIPTIFNDKQVPYVQRFLREFGKHYASRKSLLGVRLGPSANYGEAQYPATGSWGYKWGQLHTHIGYWAGDPDASVVFRNWIRSRYPTVASWNDAWSTRYESFDQAKTFLPINADSPRMRVDFATWYMDSMSEWCGRWATWAREAMPDTAIYQSSGGWGAVEIGTDYTAQAKSMAKLKGGIRLTNENDNYLNNFAATRMASSAARFYGAKLGYEPAGFGSARGVMARLFNAIGNDADHLFYYDTNFTGNDQATALWMKHRPLLDRRAKPLTEIAVFYPDTANKLSDDVLRHRLASAFFQRVYALRAFADFDYASEQMIADGALDRYKVLVFLWGRVAEKPVIDRIARWIDRGGTVIYPVLQQAREGPLGTIEGDTSVAKDWEAGKTGRGRVIFFRGYAEPHRYYIEFVRDQLRNLKQLDPGVRRALRIESDRDVYWTVLKDGTLVLLNYDDREANVRLDNQTFRVAPYTIAIR
jgi:Beta-galactosidase